MIIKKQEWDIPHKVISSAHFTSNEYAEKILKLKEVEWDEDIRANLYLIMCCHKNPYFLDLENVH